VFFFWKGKLILRKIVNYILWKEKVKVIIFQSTVDSNNKYLLFRSVLINQV